VSCPSRAKEQLIVPEFIFLFVFKTKGICYLRLRGVYPDKSEDYEFFPDRFTKIISLIFIDKHPGSPQEDFNQGKNNKPRFISRFPRIKDKG